jgi:hypothetical protein
VREGERRLEGEGKAMGDLCGTLFRLGRRLVELGVAGNDADSGDPSSTRRSGKGGRFGREEKGREGAGWGEGKIGDGNALI